MEKGWREQEEGGHTARTRLAKRGREERACRRSGGFFRLSKYETILYGYLLPPERFLAEGAHASGGTVVYVYGASTLTHKHYLVSERHKIVARASQVEAALKTRQRKTASESLYFPVHRVCARVS